MNKAKNGPYSVIMQIQVKVEVGNFVKRTRSLEEEQKSTTKLKSSCEDFVHNGIQ